MFIPIYDVNALRHIRLQYVTIGLIALNVAIWLITDLAGSNGFEAQASLSLGFIPAVIHHKAMLEPSLALLPANFTYLTCIRISPILPAICCFCGCSATMSKTLWAMSAS